MLYSDQLENNFMKIVEKVLTHFVTTFIVVLITINLTHSKQYTLEDTQTWLKKWGKHYTIDQLKTIKKLDLGAKGRRRISSLKDIHPISTLITLEELYLNRTQVSYLIPIKGLTKLKTLNLARAKVAKEQVEELKKALPNCKIDN